MVTFGRAANFTAPASMRVMISAVMSAVGAARRFCFAIVGSPGLVTLPCLDLGHHVFLHNFSDRCLFNDELTLQEGKALPQLLFALLFRAFLLLLVSCKAPLQYILHLGQTGIGFPCCLRIGQDLLHIYIDNLWILNHTTRHGECRSTRKRMQRRNGRDRVFGVFIMALMHSLRDRKTCPRD